MSSVPLWSRRRCSTGASRSSPPASRPALPSSRLAASGSGPPPSQEPTSAESHAFSRVSHARSARCFTVNLSLAGAKDVFTISGQSFYLFILTDWHCTRQNIGVCECDFFVGSGGNVLRVCCPGCTSCQPGQLLSSRHFSLSLSLSLSGERAICCTW